MKIVVNCKSVFQIQQNSLSVAILLISVITTNAVAEEREVLVKLEASASTAAFEPMVRKRTITAHPVIVRHVEGSTIHSFEDGIEIARIVESCDSVVDTYKQTHCKNTIRSEYVLEKEEHVVTTDNDGMANLRLQNKPYRILVSVIPTSEDKYCHWSGSVDINETTTFVIVPLLVYCESG